MDILEKIKEYNKFVTGSWITAEINQYKSVILKYYYPGHEKQTCAVFDTIEEFLQSDCKEILEKASFTQVRYR